MEAEKLGVVEQQESTESRLVLTMEERDNILGDSHMHIVDPILQIYDMQEACKMVIRNKVERNTNLLRTF